MITCNNCGTDNLDGSEYCDECGMKLGVSPSTWPHARDRSQPPVYQPPKSDIRYEAPNPSAEPDEPGSNHNFGKQLEPAVSTTIEGVPPAPPSFTTSTSIPKQATPARDSRQAGLSRDDSASGRSRPEAPQTLVLASRGRTDALRSDGSSTLKGRTPQVAAKLVLERGGRVGKEFNITGVETNIGRWDADSGIFPDVDLDQDDPEAKVSRRHARIVVQNGQYYIEDLGSTNGTFVNRGRRLLPGRRQMLQSGDEIIVGKTFLKFHILG